MAHIIKPSAIWETTTVTGTGAATLLGAVTGYETFGSRAANADTVPYVIRHRTANEWEAGIGTWNTGGTLTRTTPLRSSNANAAVSFSAGTKDVFAGFAEDLLPVFDNAYTLGLPLVSGTPVAPSAGLKLFARSYANRVLPAIMGPSGIDTSMQVGLHGNSVVMIGPASGTTAPTIWGGTLTTAATMSLQQTIASANPWQATSRKRFATAGTAGSGSGMRLAYAQWFRGNAAGFGGFFFRAQIGQNINLNGAQVFHGLCASTAVLATTAGAVGALLNMCGMGYDTTDASSGNWQFFRNDGSGTATKVDLGATNAARNTTHGYDLQMFCPPNDGGILYVRIVNLHSGAVVLDTSYTTDLPAVNVGMAYKSEGNNGAVASAMNLEVAKVYIESDY